LQKFQSLQLINPNKVTAQHGFDLVYFDFISGYAIENQAVTNQIKTPIFIDHDNILTAFFLSQKILTRWFHQGNLIQPLGEMINSTRNPKIHQRWVKGCDFDFKLIKYWLKKSNFSLEVGLFFKGLSLTDSAVWNLVMSIPINT